MDDLCSQHSPWWIETGFLEFTVEFEDYSQVAACDVASYPDTLPWVLQIYLYASNSYPHSREEYNVWIICSPRSTKTAAGCYDSSPGGKDSE